MNYFWLVGCARTHFCQWDYDQQSGFSLKRIFFNVFIFLNTYLKVQEPTATFTWELLWKKTPAIAIKLDLEIHHDWCYSPAIECIWRHAVLCLWVIAWQQRGSYFTMLGVVHSQGKPQTFPSFLSHYQQILLPKTTPNAPFGDCTM